MVRPLLEIQHPYLTREGFEAAVWRLSGLRDADVVEQIARAADVYAASQGPALAEKVRLRNSSQTSWADRMETFLSRQRVEALRAARGDADDDIMVESDPAAEPESSGATIYFYLPSGKPANAWETPDGRLIQRCTKCGEPKSYDDFYADKNRWNGKSTQCKRCKNSNRGDWPSTYQKRAAAAGAGR